MAEPIKHQTADVTARLLLVLLSLGWGLTWPVMKIALDEIPPFSMRVTSTFIGAVTLCGIALIQGHSLGIRSLRAWLHIFVAAQFNITFFSIFTPFAQLSAATSRVTIIAYTMPIWAALLALPILGERLTVTRTLALALCAAGMTVLIYPLATAGIPVGILLALGTATSWAAGTVYLKWAKIEGDPTAVTFWQLFFGFVAVAAVFWVVEGSYQVFHASTEALLATLFSGMVGSGIAYFLWFEIVRRMPATTASLGALSVPAVGVLSSMLLLGERPTLPDFVGFALIFAASACVLLAPREAKRVERKAM